MIDFDPDRIAPLLDKYIPSDLHLSAKKITGRSAIQWAAIAAAHEKTGKMPVCNILELFV